MIKSKKTIISMEQVVITILLFVICYILFSCNNKSVSSKSVISAVDDKMAITTYETKPDYLYYTTLGNNDLYMATNHDIITFENGERKIILKMENTSAPYMLSDIQRICKSNINVDKEENLYMPKYAWDKQKLYVIDKNLNTKLLTDNCLSFAIVDETMFYTEGTPSGVHKYENGKNEIIFKHGNKLLRINKLDDKSFALTKTKIVNGPVDYEALSANEEDIIISDNQWKTLLYKDGEFTIYTGEIKEAIPLYNKNKKLDSTERIKKYIKDDFEREFEETKIKNNEELNNNYNELDDYLYFDNEGRVSYYFKGNEVREMLVFVEGTMKTNRGRICFPDTYAYYFGKNGKAMKRGKITPADKDRFDTDENYRILKECKNIYDLTISKNKYELYNSYFLFGKYEQDAITENEKEDIKWIVIEDNGTEVLLLSKYILDYRKYDPSYLNGEFYNNSFSEEEKQKIVNKNNSKLFLIDEETLDDCKYEYKKKYNNSSHYNLLSAIPTTNTVNKGIEISKDDDDYYGHASYLISNNKIVKADGITEKDSNLDEKVGIRPAMWVRKD